MATLDVLSAAHKAGKKLRDQLEPTFWHDPEPMPGMEDDPVYRFKREFVEKNRMIVWRQHDQVHGVRPIDFRRLANALGWKNRDRPTRGATQFCGDRDAVASHHAKRPQDEKHPVKVGDPQLK